MMAALTVKYTEKRLFDLEDAAEYCGTVAQLNDLIAAGLLKPDRYEGKSRIIFSKERLDAAIDRWLAGAYLPKSTPAQMSQIRKEWEKELSR